MGQNSKKGFFWLLLIGGTFVYYYNNNTSSQNSNSNSFTHEAKAQVTAVSANMPSSEQSFIQIIQSGHRAYDAASNDMQKGATRPR